MKMIQSLNHAFQVSFLGCIYMLMVALATGMASHQHERLSNHSQFNLKPFYASNTERSVDQHIPQRRLNSSTKETIYITGFIDMNEFDWGKEIFDFTLQLLDDHQDGWYDSLLDDGTVLEWDVVDSACDGSTAARAYWDLRTANGNQRIDGIIGSRCSGATIAVASIATLEEVPHVSFSAASSKLSDKDVFPFFSRVVAPDTEQGMVGAFVRILRKFGWSRVSILTSDTAWGKDLTTNFQNVWLGKHEDDDDAYGASWEGEVAFSNTILLDSNSNLDEDSIVLALQSIPTDDPTINSRVIMIFAHSDHALSILETAAKIGFQPDTIWIGADLTVHDVQSKSSWIPPVPGYFGLEPRRFSSKGYNDYLRRLQTEQALQGREPWDDLPEYAADYLVDSIISLVKAFNSTEPRDRRNGTIVTENLRSQRFDGLTETVIFTDEGDRKNPMYSLRSLQWQQDGQLSWVDVGMASPFSEALLNISSMCFAGFGCRLDRPPTDRYPVPKQKVPRWVTYTIVFIVVLLLVVSCKLLMTRRKKKMYKDAMEQKKEIDSGIVNIQKVVEEAKQREAALIKKRFDLQEKPDTWSKADHILVEVDSANEQYWKVLARLRETMPDAYISKLWRVQNNSLWTYYSFHKERLAMQGSSINEQWVFHGTTSLDPSVVYEDQQDGFMMQFARAGFWGRGIYFAMNGSYSHSYSYRCDGQVQGRLEGESDEREMFLAKLLAGDDICMDRDASLRMEQECQNLIAPPFKPSSKQRYSSVSGNTGGSKVWIVYENGRAYPDYLVRYYRRGSRDSTRTPFETKTDALKFAGTIPTTVADSQDQSTATCNIVASALELFVWEYLDNNGWIQYAGNHQTELENAFQKGKNNGKTIKVRIDTSEWTYEVDIDRWVQTNVLHVDKRERSVRRRPVTPV